MSELDVSDQNETEEKPLSPLRAIRRHCLTCAGRPSEVRECRTLECKLHRFRMGRNPARAGIGPGSILKSSFKEILDDSMAVSKETGAEEGKGMAEAVSFNCGPKNGDMKPPVNMDSQGRIKISRTDKGMVIELTTES